MKKLRLFVVAMFAMVAMFAAVKVNAEDITYPTVEDATATDSLSNSGDKPTIGGSNTAKVTVTVDKGEWTLVDYNKTDESTVEGRDNGYTWVGLKFTMPTGATNVKIGSTEETPNSNSFIEYFGFNEEEVKEATKAGHDLVKTFTLTWKKDSTDYSQTIELVVKADKITLKGDDEDTTQVWDQEKYTQSFAEGVQERTHKVTISDQIKNGTVTVDEETALEGSEVTLTVKPAEGYELDTLTVTDKDSKAVEVKDNKFTMPNSDVTVVATFKKVEQNPQTGDNILIYGIIGIVSFGALCLCSRFAVKHN